MHSISICTAVAVACASLLCVHPPMACGQSTANEPAIRPVEIPGTECRSIHSNIMEGDFDLSINLPGTYGDTNKTFPAIYLLDAQWDFPLVSAVYGEQYYDGFLPALVTIGISWAGRNINYDSLRLSDFTPSVVSQFPQSGKAGKFLRFFREELLPYVEAHYRVDRSDRTIMGSSLGGLLTLYAMFHEHGLFQRFVLTGPTLDWGQGILDSTERRFASENTTLPVRLFMGIGGLEPGVTEFQKFVDRLRARNYTGLALSSLVIKDIGHSGSKAEGYTRGLQAVFARPSVAVEASTLQTYTGTYQNDRGITIEFRVENNGLTFFDPGCMAVP